MAGIGGQSSSAHEKDKEQGRWNMGINPYICGP
jgi:hypothetical protein